WCGTLHRITEERGACRVTALPRPIRSAPMVTLRDISGEEFETPEWFTEDDWRPVGPYPGGIRGAGQLHCSYCGRVGPMLWQESSLSPGSYAPGAARQEECPVCHGRMECIAVKDAI